MSAPDLTCIELVEIVTDYLEGTLPPGDRSRFEEHMGLCEGCRAYLDQMQETIRLVGRLSEDDLPKGSGEELLQAFRGWKAAR
jgi:anti-sigma factor RsiW